MNAWLGSFSYELLLINSKVIITLAVSHYNGD